MKRLYKAVSVLMSLITVFSVFAIVPLEVSAAEGIEYLPLVGFRRTGS